jgi:hypothetical protein
LNYGTKTTLSAAAAIIIIIVVITTTAATLVAVGGGAAITPVTAFAYDGGVWGELDGTTIARQQNNQAKKSMDLIVHSKKRIFESYLHSYKQQRDLFIRESYIYFIPLPTSIP